MTEKVPNKGRRALFLKTKKLVPEKNDNESSEDKALSKKILHTEVGRRTFNKGLGGIAAKTTGLIPKLPQINAPLLPNRADIISAVSFDDADKLSRYATTVIHQLRNHAQAPNFDEYLKNISDPMEILHTINVLSHSHIFPKKFIELQKEVFKDTPHIDLTMQELLEVSKSSGEFVMNLIMYKDVDKKKSARDLLSNSKMPVKKMLRGISGAYTRELHSLEENLLRTIRQSTPEVRADVMQRWVGYIVDGERESKYIPKPQWQAFKGVSDAFKFCEQYGINKDTILDLFVRGDVYNNIEKNDFKGDYADWYDDFINLKKEYYSILDHISLLEEDETNLLMQSDSHNEYDADTGAGKATTELMQVQEDLIDYRKKRDQALR